MNKGCCSIIKFISRPIFLPNQSQLINMSNFYYEKNIFYILVSSPSCMYNEQIIARSMSLTVD